MNLPLSDFDFSLPETHIATFPVAKRDDSKLMIVDRRSQEIAYSTVSALGDFLIAGDLLIMNNTKVIHCRFFGVKDTGARMELLLIRAISPSVWEALVKPAKRVSSGTIIYLDCGVRVTVLSHISAGLMQIAFPSEIDVAVLMQNSGILPLPPYLEIPVQRANSFNEVYQTVFASEPGAVAAPTAGLHFTPELISDLLKKGINISYVTLHVGLGTFKPIVSENIVDHEMHPENYVLPAQTVQAIVEAQKRGSRIISVGTTSTRVIEGVNLQFGKIQAGEGSLNCYIYPGFKFGIISAMMTNFHLPKSTLLVMITAFMGQKLRQEAYQKAIENDFRFYSFGDSMLIL